MPSTASKSQQMVSIIVGASGWTISVTIGSKVPVRDGYSFKNWNTAANGTGTSYDPGDTVGVTSTSTSAKMASRTLYAQWTQLPKPTSWTITVTYNSNTTDAVSNMPLKSTNTSTLISQTIDGYWSLSLTLRTNVPTRTGYKFLNWNTASNGTGLSYDPGDRISFGASSIYTSSASEILYAQWEKLATPTVYFDATGGSPSFSEKTVTYSYTYDDLPTASRGGYSFSGWFTSSSGGSQVTSSTTVNTVGNHKLYAHWTKNVYKVDINILSPSGEQDYNSGAMDVKYSYSGNSFTGKNDQPEDQVDYQGTITISNINPATGYYVSSVTCTSGTLSSSNGTYTYTATMTGTPSGSWDDAIVIQMAWKEFPININILSPNGVEDNNSGTMDLRYSDGVTVNDVNNENVVDGTSKKLRYGWTIVISDIKPSGKYNLKSVTCDKGTLTDNGDGSYTYTCNFGNEANGTGALITIQMTYLFYDEDEGYYYIEDGEYPQSYALDLLYEKTVRLNGSGATVPNALIKTDFLTNDVFYIKITLEGGEITDYPSACFALDVVGNSGAVDDWGDRNHIDIAYPTPTNKIMTGKLVINSSWASKGVQLLLWDAHNSSTPKHNNTVIKFEVYKDITPNLTNSAVGTAEKISIDTKEYSIYTYENEKYVWIESPKTQTIKINDFSMSFTQGTKYWFKVEPIRWRVTDYATTLKVTTAGGWEIIGQSINVKTNTDYTLSLNYSTPSAGIPNFMVLSASPQNNNCSSINIASYQLSGNYKGEINLTFNSGNYSQVYVILNFGYVNDGTTYTFEFGNLRISDKSVEIEENISKWTKYQYSNAFSISETSAVASNGVMTNYTAVSDKVLTVGAVTSNLNSVKEGWGFRSGNLYTTINSLSSFVDCENDIYTNAKYDKYGSVSQQVKVTSETVQQDGIRVASVEEIDAHIADISAKASDLVCFLLGKNVDDKVNYWTRNLGSSLDNGQVVTSAGVIKSNWLNRQNGVRFAMTMTVGGGV